MNTSTGASGLLGRGSGSLARGLDWAGGEPFAFVVSLVFHLAAMLVLGLIPLPARAPQTTLVIDSQPPQPLQEFELPQEFFPTEDPVGDIGANSLAGSEAMLSLAPEISDLSLVSNPVEYLESDLGEIQINRTLNVTTGLHFHTNLTVKGATGEGVTGAEGAIDRITQEILHSLYERKTMVVWLIDQSPSLAKQHQLIRDRLDRIYEELGVIEAAGNPAFKKHDDKPLLTSVYLFGERVLQVMDKPTDNIEEIRLAVTDIPLDESGVEKVFSAIYLAAKQNESYRKPNSRTHEPDRNVLLIVFTDEAGDDQVGLEETVKLCRSNAMPVYVVGAPAPFGRKETYLKFVDPDPRYDQTPQWGVVDQGPETMLPERLKIGFGEAPEDEVPIDSGFGPFGLTRLCYETGGVYFAVHPNRNVHRAVSRGETSEFAAHIKHFFDPQIMRHYQPDYVSVEEYKRRVSANKARAALVNAAQLSWIEAFDLPEMRFVKRDEGVFLNELSQAQFTAARMQPQLERIYEVLKAGEADREQEASPRWQAGYDLAMGRLLATRARTEAYNSMLAKAKRGMRFSDEKNNTWVLKPSDDLSSVGSQLEKMAERAAYYLNRVMQEHEGTPWALLAQKELETPLGWEWVDEYTDLSPPPRPQANNNNNPPPVPAPPRDDAARRLERKPVREFKKL